MINMQFLTRFLLFLSFVILGQSAWAQQTCGTCKDVIFIVDNSGSIDDWEFSTMQTSIDQLSNQILASNPTTRIAVIQYGGEDVTLNPGLYDISVPFSSNPVTVASWNRVFGPAANIYNDFLPASMASMRLDGIWDAGGELDIVSSPCRPVFILFTDAYGNAEGWGSTLFNAGGLPGLVGYGEYNYMKTTYDATFIVYHVTADDPTVAPLVGSAISSVGGSYTGPIDPNPGDPEGSQTIPRNYYTGSFQFNPVTVNDIVANMANTQSSFDYTDDCTGFVEFQSTSSSSQTIISWEWDFGDGSGSTLEDPSHTFSPGTYDVSLIVEGDLGCRDTIVETLEIIQIVPFAVSDTSICSSDQIVLGEPAVAGQSYQWSPATGLSSATVAQPTASPNATTTYSLVITGDNGCQTSAETVQVTVSSSPAINMTNSHSICIGDDVTIGPVENPAFTYAWTPSTTLSDAAAAQPVANPQTTTTYTLTLTTPSGCSGTASTTVTVHPLPNVSAGPDLQLCYGDTVVLSGFGAISYQWSGGAVNGDEFVPNTGTISYTVTGTDGFGCVNSDVLVVTTYALPQADFMVDNQVLSSLDTEVEFTNQSNNAASYFWSFGDGVGTSTETSPVYEFEDGVYGTMPVMLIATSPEGCVDTAFVYLLINEETIFYVPNAFTPNGDEYNNEFTPVITSGYDIYNYSFFLYNRWGEIIFESHDPSKGWNGNYNGTPAPDGLYTWRMDLKLKNNDDKETYSGHVTLIK